MHRYTSLIVKAVVMFQFVRAFKCGFHPARCRSAYFFSSITKVAVPDNTIAKMNRPFIPNILKSTTADQDIVFKDELMSKKSTIIADDHEFERSKLDRRKYRAIELKSNGQPQVLLVSDDETDVEAGSVHVRAGHFDDPEDRAGLAHFHEHMVFLGSEKYPAEGDFEAYLAKNGGSTNAYTDMEDTNYYFSITPGDDDDDALTGALDRFAQFFICPTFETSAVERELRAINSEYLNSITSDNWRNYQILKCNANPSHPFVKFGCGNYNTLTNGGDISKPTLAESGGTNPRDILLDFWDKNYHGGNIKLCVLGRANLDELQESVENTFENVRPAPSNGVKSGYPALSQQNPLKITTKSVHTENDLMFAYEGESYGDIPFRVGHELGIIREIIPAKETRKITISFAIPPLHSPLIDVGKPHRVISHLLGHESPGSLHSVLSDEGLIFGLSSGVGVDVSDFALFNINLSLTAKGMSERDRVLDLFWQWMSIIQNEIWRDESEMEKYHDELRQLSEISYTYKENTNPTDFCSSKAECLFYTPAKDILSAAYKTGEYDADVARAFFSRLTPQNCMMLVWDPDHKKSPITSRISAVDEEWKVEKWYKGEYRQMKIPTDIAEEWKDPKSLDSRLFLPKMNTYIPTDFSLRCEDPDFRTITPEESESVEPPVKLIDSENLRLWHKTDAKFKVPRTSFHMAITSPIVYSSPRTMTQARLFEKVLKDDLNSHIYDASLAGISYGVVIAVTGIRIKVGGYSQKVTQLIETLLNRIIELISEMKNPENNHEDSVLYQKYGKSLESLRRQTANFQLDPPYEVCDYNTRLIVEENVWTVSNYLAEMNDTKNPLTMLECANIMEETLLGSIRIEALCMGNVGEDEALKIADVLRAKFLEKSRILSDEETPRFRSLKLPTYEEAKLLFDDNGVTYPIVYEELAKADMEDNNAIELYLQVGQDQDMKYEGIAILDLIAHIAYTSAFNTLRTQEQLGYIVSTYPRNTAGGAHGLSIVIQSSSKLPSELEERCEAWLVAFREELANLSEEMVEMEAGAVVAQLLERDTRLGQEIDKMWSQIIGSECLSSKDREPVFGRLEKLAATIDVDDEINAVSAADIKQKMLHMFDQHLAPSAPMRRALSSRVYGQSSKEAFENNTGKSGILQGRNDARHLKLSLGSWPIKPYWK
eukprot:CAMPEP_0116006758 /NCGR_PEP_ID=MMETSP0321-20121206/1916_1 /TAXON_ID=163516 /ORGANISM="Leptocylindrus danicus var. danicus, Strain B650" /LENGTH=1168 /DNA_ID=CAMNT_0003475367 /DNA_START=833 /DNA_END=4340 /DNA_ORIENTATION=-